MNDFMSSVDQDGISELFATAGQKPQQQDGTRVRFPTNVIALSRIIADSKTQTRQTTFDPTTSEEDATLVASVKTHGVIQPVLVQKITGDETTYQVVFGHRRIAASRAAGHKTIEARVARSDEDVELLTLIENMGHKEISDYELLLGIQKIQGFMPEMSVKAIAEVIGINEQRAWRLTRLGTEGHPVVREVLKEGKFSNLRALEKMDGIMGQADKKEQRLLATAVETMSLAVATRIADDVAAGMSPTQALALATHVGDAAPVAPPTPSVESQPASNKKKRAPKKKPAKAAVIYNPNDPQFVEAIRRITGTTGAKIKDLAGQAAAVNPAREVFLIACLYVNNGGEVTGAIERVKKAMSSRKVELAVTGRIEQLQRAKSAISEADEDAADVIAKVVRI